jgi:hypothetical protein
MYIPAPGGFMPFLRTDFSEIFDPTPSRADLIASELDQRRIGDGLQTWVVHVFGVHGDGRDLWIQVSDNPDGEDGFVLHLSPWATAQHAVAALSAIHPHQQPHPHVVPVMLRA